MFHIKSQSYRFKTRRVHDDNFQFSFNSVCPVLIFLDKTQCVCPRSPAWSLYYTVKTLSQNVKCTGKCCLQHLHLPHSYSTKACIYVEFSLWWTNINFTSEVPNLSFYFHLKRCEIILRLILVNTLFMLFKLLDIVIHQVFNLFHA